tara:strand:+ start:3044 stop:3520 length:477 start_codon:yes stop_codon:yes gene_type:complete
MKITKAQLKKLIAEELEEIRVGGMGGYLPGETGGMRGRVRADVPGTEESPCAMAAAEEPPDLETRVAAIEDKLDMILSQLQISEEANRTAKGNVTQAAREKYATVGDDGFPIFDKKSAKAAIDLRGHAPEADRSKIINKAAKRAPEAAKKAREADKKK